MAAISRLGGAGSQNSVARLSAKDIREAAQYSEGYMDGATDNPYGLSDDLLAKQAVIDANTAALEADPDIKQGQKAQNLLAKYAAEIDAAIQNYTPPGEDPVDTDPPETGGTDPVETTNPVTTEPVTAVVESSPVVTVNPVTGNSGTVGTVNTITQVSEQEANAYNEFGNYNDLGNNNNISGNGSLVINAQQTAGDNIATNNSTQMASINNASTVYNPYTGAQEVNLFAPGSFTLNPNPVLDKFLTKPFVV